MPTWYAFGLVPEPLLLGFDFQGPVDLGAGVELIRVPAWLRGAAYIPGCTPECVGRIVEAQAGHPEYALVREYEAPSIESPDPEWQPPPETMSYERTSVDRLMLTTEVVWLVQPGSTLRFRGVLHAAQDGGARIAAWTNHPQLYRGHVSFEPLSLDQLEQARGFNEFIGTMHRAGPLWTALRSLWGALQEAWFHNRYALLWVALEALFGPRDPGEATHRISQNLALFLEDEPGARAATFRQAKRDYHRRSLIAHGEGGGIEQAEFEALMERAQEWLRRALVRILSSAEMRPRFATAEQRDEFFTAAVLRAQLA